MGIWVKSQDRTLLVLCDNFYVDFVYDAESRREAKESHDRTMRMKYNIGSTREAEILAYERTREILSKAKVTYNIKSDDCTLGSYETEEKAMSVLVEI